MWWPSPDSFLNMTVIDTDDGWTLSAPDNTELAEWLNYWNQDEEHQQFFNKTFVTMLCDHAKLTLEQHGETEAITDEQSHHRVETEDDLAGSQS